MSDNISKGIEAVEAVAVIAVVGIGGYLVYKLYQCLQDPTKCFGNAIKEGIDAAGKAIVDGSGAIAGGAADIIGEVTGSETFKEGAKVIEENVNTQNVNWENINKYVPQAFNDLKDQAPGIWQDVKGFFTGYKPRFNGNVNYEAEINSEPAFREACDNYDPPGKICKRNGTIYCSIPSTNKFFSMNLSRPRKRYPAETGNPCAISFQYPDSIQNLNDFVNACGNIGLGKAVECRDNNKVYCNIKGQSKYYEWNKTPNAKQDFSIKQGYAPCYTPEIQLADQFSSMCGSKGWLMCGWSDGTKQAGSICLNPNNNKEWYLHKNGSNTYQDMSNTGRSAECQWHP